MRGRYTFTVTIDVIGFLLAAYMMFLFVAFGWSVATLLVSLGIATQAVPYFLGASVLIGLFVIYDIASGADI